MHLPPLVTSLLSIMAVFVSMSISAVSSWTPEVYLYPRQRRHAHAYRILQGAPYHSHSRLHQSAASDPSIGISKKDDNGTTTTTSTTVGSDQQQTVTVTQQQTQPQPSSSLETTTTTTTKYKLDLPWSDLQEWALRDQYQRFTVQAPVTVGGKETMKIYTLWRTMSQEVIEISGYPIPFLQDRLQAITAQDDAAGTPGTYVLVPSSDVLPFLDEFEFESQGGLSGRVYGVAGVADGTRIQTTPVGDVQVTVPRGFVRTADGSVIYELGRPVSTSATSDNSSYSLSDMASSADARSKALRKVQDEASAWAGSLSNIKADLNLKEADVDSDLIRLAGITAVVLGGALAVDLLSHHLTINMFWV